MILSGQKKVEYRSITPYWCNRFLLVMDSPGFHIQKSKCWWRGFFLEKREYAVEDVLISMLTCGELKFINPDTITFTNGMQTDSPRFEIELKNISIGYGLKAWGAEPNKFYFCLELGALSPKIDPKDLMITTRAV